MACLVLYYTAPSSPYNLTAVNITSNSFILVWEQPDPPNGLIVNYSVRLCVLILLTHDDLVDYRLLPLKRVTL